MKNLRFVFIEKPKNKALISMITYDVYLEHEGIFRTFIGQLNYDECQRNTLRKNFNFIYCLKIDALRLLEINLGNPKIKEVE